MMFIQSFIAQASGLAAPLMRYVRRRWLRTLIWALAACLVVFFYGDAIRFRSFEPLAGNESRLIACIVILLAWAGYNAFMFFRERRANKAMIGALVNDGPSSKADLSTQEVERLRTRLQEALTQLRRMVGGRRGYLYQLPWYIMIGPPGSGKTTALLNSGLKFPLAETMGREPVEGIGGTRNCDWWFTEDAILLDTAGRYTTQDSDPEVDQKGWSGFLSLLKSYRPLQPINGVIIALSLEDLARGNAQERLANAQAIRARLGELTRSFGSRFPVYLLLTKADLIAGFVPFFDAYNRTDREQVWGMTFPLDDGQQGTQAAASRFDIEFDGLLTRMNAIVLERLQQESDIQRRGLIYGFPIQVATLKEPIHEILDEIFAGSKFDRRPLLRGVYFASGTQMGAPIDRMMGAMANTFGMDAPRQPAFSGKEKSYFLTRLLNNVVFAEANVVAADPKLRRRMARTRIAAGAVAAVLVVGLLGAWAVAYAQNKALVAKADRQIAEYRKEVVGIPTTNVDDADFFRVVPPLDILRDSPAELRHDAGSAWLHAGLDQSAKLQSQYASVYDRALNELLLPRVLVFLQKRMRNASTTDDEFKTATLRVYLGLGGAGPVDKPFVRKWMEAEWAALYPGPDKTALRDDLNRHFATLVDGPLQQVALDADLIAVVRGQIQKEPVAARAYARLRDSAAAQALSGWNVLDVGGAGVPVAFTRTSGAPLTNGIPGFYTRKGYFDVLLPGLQEAVNQVQADRWVYGEQAGTASGTSVVAQAITLYRADFEARWTQLLNDLRIRPLTDLGGSVKVMNVLSGPDSVLVKLVNGIVATTDLSAPPADAKDVETLRIRGIIAASMPSAPGSAEPAQPFAPLRAAMSGQNGQPSQIAELMRTLQSVYEEVSKTSGSPSGAIGVVQTEAGLNDANQKLQSQGRQMPAPVDTWLTGLTSGMSAVTTGAAKTAMAEAWAGGGQKLCQDVAAGKYPFNRRASSAISIDDFNRLFGPNGTMDNFFQQNLKTLVDTSRHPWTLMSATGAAAVSTDFLSQFEHADAIRQAFFAGSGATFHYEVIPDYLSGAFNQETLDIGGQTLTYAHGPVRPTTMVWPAPNDTGVRLSLEPDTAGVQPLTFDGPWAPFRMIDASSVYAATRDGFTFSMVMGGQTISFRIKSGSSFNPFTLRDLRQFRCPGTL